MKRASPLMVATAALVGVAGAGPGRAQGPAPAGEKIHLVTVTVEKGAKDVDVKVAHFRAVEPYVSKNPNEIP